jgi:hypothetical protein
MQKTTPSSRTAFPTWEHDAPLLVAVGAVTAGAPPARNGRIMTNRGER